VDGGSGHSGKRAPTLHFGLGRLAAGTPLRVEVRWRDAGGTLRDRTLWLTPGWHRVMLDAAGAAGAAGSSSQWPAPQATRALLRPPSIAASASRRPSIQKERRQ
jgi:hypothetical protein